MRASGAWRRHLIDLPSIQGVILSNTGLRHLLRQRRGIFLNTRYGKPEAYRYVLSQRRMLETTIVKESCYGESVRVPTLVGRL